MKKGMKTTIILMVNLLLFSSLAIGQQKINATTKGAKVTRIEQAIAARDIHIMINQAMPLNHPTIQLTSDYWLRLKHDSAFVYLPYYGRAYSVPYNGGGGFDFAKQRINDTINVKKDGESTWQFSVRTDDDNYQFIVWISSDGYANITVNCNNRQSISYYGECVLPETTSAK
jgi:hypothetical protein